MDMVVGNQALNMHELDSELGRTTDAEQRILVRSMDLVDFPVRMDRMEYRSAPVKWLGNCQPHKYMDNEELIVADGKQSHFVHWLGYLVIRFDNFVQSAAVAAAAPMESKEFVTVHWAEWLWFETKSNFLLLLHQLAQSKEQ